MEAGALSPDSTRAIFDRYFVDKSRSRNKDSYEQQQPFSHLNPLGNSDGSRCRGIIVRRWLYTSPDVERITCGIGTVAVGNDAGHGATNRPRARERGQWETRPARPKSTIGSRGSFSRYHRHGSS